MSPRHHSPFLSTNSPVSALVFPNQQQLKNYEPLARVCAAFIQELFEKQLPPGIDTFFPPNTFLGLPFFIAYAISQSPLDSPTVVIAALSLLYRYKSRIFQRHPKLRDPSRLFLTAYLVAAKLLSDKTYPMRTWASLGQNNYDVHELAVMERELCAALNWDLNLNPEVLDSFRIIIEAFLSRITGSGSPSRCSPERNPETPPLELSTSPQISEHCWSPCSNSSFWLSGSPVTTREEWVVIQEEMEQSQTSLEELNRRIIELECEYGALLSRKSPKAHYIEPAKPSMTKRISKLLQVRFGGSPLRRTFYEHVQ